MQPFLNNPYYDEKKLLSPDFIHNPVEDLLADGVMPARIIVRGILFAATK